jgi:hypothetical protein
MPSPKPLGPPRIGYKPGTDYPITEVKAGMPPAIGPIAGGAAAAAAARAIPSLPKWLAPLLAAVGLGSFLLGNGDERPIQPETELAGPAFPWQTPGGMGFIAPWTEAYQGPTGLFYEVGKPFEPVMIAPGEWILKRWDNGSAASAPTVQFFKTNKRVFYQNLITGEWGTFRQRKPIVISHDPRMSKVAKIDRLHNKLKKLCRKVAK